MGPKQDPFENKGNDVSDEEITKITTHEGGEWHPFGDHTVNEKPPVKRVKE